MKPERAIKFKTWSEEVAEKEDLKSTTYGI